MYTIAPLAALLALTLKAFSWNTALKALAYNQLELKVSNVSVLNWIKGFGKTLKENVKIEYDFDVARVDEM